MWRPLLLLMLLASTAGAETIPDPCANYLAVINRPTIADSACVMKTKQASIELGYEYQNLKAGGQGYNLPQASVRVGFFGNNELVGVLPNYNHQSMTPRAGFEAPSIGLKHEFGYTATWLGAMEGLVTLPTGSEAFGSAGVGGAVNAIVTYSMNAQISFSLMLGVTSQTTPSFSGGQRYTSVNPDLVLSYLATEKWEIYGELYGQTRTGPGMGAGFNTGAGLLYLVTPQIVADAELGQRISGQLGSFNSTLGVGLSVLF